MRIKMMKPTQISRVQEIHYLSVENKIYRVEHRKIHTFNPRYTHNSYVLILGTDELILADGLSLSEEDLKRLINEKIDEELE